MQSFREATSGSVILGIHWCATEALRVRSLLLLGHDCLLGR